MSHRVHTIAVITSLVIVSIIFFMPSQTPCIIPDIESCANDTQPISPPTRMNVSCPITWVTAYYRTPSKHSFHEYNQWIRNMQAINMCLVVYTDTLDMWTSPSSMTVVIPTDLCSGSRWHLNLTLKEWQRELSIDPECHIHQHYKLYWVWALKAFFLNTTAVADPFGSKAFFWIDSGYFRDHSHDGLDIRSTSTSLVRPGAVAFLQVEPFTEQELKIFEPILHNGIAGGLFGGSAEAVQSWCKRYKHMLAVYQSKGWFLGKDQTVMATACLETLELCQLIEPNPLISINPWFSMFESIIHTI